MKQFQTHIWQCFVAGIVALLPIVGMIITIVYCEEMVSESWLSQQGFYFFGLGILIVLVATYFIGLFFSNVIGKWVWDSIDLILIRTPILGNLYQTLKQILGYGEGEDAIFQRVVFVKTKDFDGEEIGLVTRENIELESSEKLAVFLPFSPSPINGRLVFVDKSIVRESDMSVNDALKSLVSIGTMVKSSASRK
ncbi:DUF502 domain-containing protein [Pirellulaceae bacterium]|jgi:uncharacterized membrane protein|nr:DUF502 domain-containing protein [Pirellulaceae bacterium]